MTKEEALKLALDDLIAEYHMETSSFAKRVDEIFKQALAAPVQEPFMWVCNSLDETVWETSKHKECEHCIPLYTTPPAAQPAPVQEPIKPDTLSLEQLLRAAVYWGATYAKGDYHDALEGKIYQWISLRSGATPPAAPVQEPVQLTIPEGMVLVPYEPSTEMQEQGSTASGYDLSQKRARHVYQSMIDMHVVREGKQARSAPVQEPVAWTVSGKITDWSKDFSAYQTKHYTRPVYTPPAQPAPVQEPVAWMHTMIDDVVVGHRPADLNVHPDRWMPLYKDPTPCQTCQALARTVMMDQTAHDTTPPAAQRQWVGLTAEERTEIAGFAAISDWHDFEVIDAVEAKLKEKNNG